MKSAHQIAFLNMIFIIINCFWIIIVDTKKIYGVSIYDTFYYNWSYLTPHVATFNIWKVITIILVLTSILYCVLLKNEHKENVLLVKQIESCGNWMLLNQLFLGVSMVFKLNNYLILAYICSIGTFYTLYKLNILFKIRDYSNPEYIHFFTRTSLGLYSGWFVYLLGFNGIPIFSNILDLSPDHKFLFVIALIFLIGSFSFIWYKAMLCRLPAILVGYTVGLLGSFFYNISISNPSYNVEIMRYVFIVFLVVAIFSIVFLLYVRRKSFLFHD